jgi:5-methylthioadenosine/S-adenosylhomocysteine deaminase
LKSVDILLTGGTVITQNNDRERIDSGAVAVAGDTIEAVGNARDLEKAFSPRRSIDFSGKYLFPGLIDTHTHQFQNFVKGVGQGLKLFDWVEAVTEPAARLMTGRDCYLAAAVGLLQAARAGTTTVLDYMYPMPSSQMYTHFARAFENVGIRGILGWGFLDCGEEHGLPKSLMRPVKDVLDDLDKHGPEMTGERVTAALAPGVVFGVTAGSLKDIRDYATDKGMLISMHLNETGIDDAAVLADHGKRAVPYLDELGFLGPDLLAVHCVKMEREDMDLFQNNGVKVSHNPSSNMYLGSGIAPVLDMRSRGITVGLATDSGGSNSNDMLEVMEDAAFLQKVAYEDPAVITAQDILDIATRGGAEAIGGGNELGSLEKGKKADMFVFDPIRPRSVPVLDPAASLVFSSGPENVVLTMVGGHIILENGSITTIDETELLAESQTAAIGLAERSGTLSLIRG